MVKQPDVLDRSDNAEEERQPFIGHIFISYSHKDSEYAHSLAEHLQSMGFTVWIDNRIDYGSQWPREIQKQLDSCDAFILIMSSRSFASEWVQSELQRAKRKSKPVFPLLLEGDETWLSVESTQYYDVRNRSLPNNEFYADLKQGMSAQSPSRPQRSATKAEKAEPVRKLRTVGRKTTGLFAVGGVAAVCICLLTGVIWFTRMAEKGSFLSSPTARDIVTAGSNTTSSVPEISTVISPIPTVATPIVLPVELPDGSEVRMVDAGGEYQYTILSAQREGPLQGKYLLRLRIRAWTNAGAMPLWSDSFRLVAGDLTIAPVNDLNLLVRQDETVDGDVEFEIDTLLKEAILRIRWGNSSAAWAIKELRMVFP